jgi:hypothetical protein
MYRYGGKDGVIWVYIHSLSESATNFRFEDVVMEPEIAS